MSEHTIRGRRQRLLILGAWTFYALFFAGDLIIGRAYDGRPLMLGRTLIQWLVCGYIWAAWTPFVLALARRFPLDGQKWPRSLAVHISASALFAFLQLSAYFAAISLLRIRSGNVSWIQAFKVLFIVDYHVQFLTYWAIVAIALTANYYWKYRERESKASQLELKAAQLESRLAQAQLEALKMQLHPHFLFNTLNSISVLMRDDVDAANRMLVE